MSAGDEDGDASRRPPRPPRRGLTAEAFEALLKWLDPEDRERAGRLYEEIRRKLVRLFEWRGCDFPEDRADETLNRVARRLAEGVGPASDIYSYACGVAHRIVKEVWRQRDRELRYREAQGSAEVAEPAIPALEEPDEDLAALNRCLDRLKKPEDRRLLLRYYESDDRIRGRRQLADEERIALNALRIRVHRLRRAVEDCLAQSRRQ